MRRTRRTAFSLLEVMLATAILLGCVIVLAELASIGNEHANAARDFGTAHRLCQNKLNELLSGIAPLEEVESAPLEEEEGWVYTVALQATSQPGLAALKVTVSRDPALGPRTRDFTLVQWVPYSGATSDELSVPEEPIDDLPGPPAMQPEGLP